MKQQATNEATPRERDSLLGADVETRDSLVSYTQESRSTDQPANPILILAAITLGIPLLAMILLIGMNPSVEGGMLTTITMFLVLSAFVTGAVFEIKRLADQPSDGSHP